MLYKLAHIIRDRFTFLWDAIEWGNALVFAFTHKTALNTIPDVLKGCGDRYSYRLAQVEDVPALAAFFARQPKEAFTHFKPHAFDEKTLKRVCGNKAFVAFVVCDGSEIVGYFFLRCFFCGKAFRGKMVDSGHQGEGIATEMGRILTQAARLLNVRVYGTISPENYASMASAKHSNKLKIIKTLDNGDYYIEFFETDDI